MEVLARLGALCLILTIVVRHGAGQCNADSLALYHVHLVTGWTPEAFPRHYPGLGRGYRPSASFSKLLGRTHNSSYTLFRIGEMATPGLKEFAETSSSDALNEFSQGSTGVLDVFNAPPILSGEGQTQTQFFVDADHSKVSMVVRIVPSPDWFCGVDSVELCRNDEWVDSLSFDLVPIDAGTDNGYTFSSPNWETQPPEAIYHIYSARLHPAHSFYRDDRSQRPKPLGTLNIFKLKVYSLAELRNPRSLQAIDPVKQYHITRLLSNDIYTETGEGSLHRDSSRAEKKKRSKNQRGPNGLNVHPFADLESSEEVVTSQIILEGEVLPAQHLSTNDFAILPENVGKIIFIGESSRSTANANDNRWQWRLI